VARLVTPFSEFPVDDFSLSDLFLDTKRLQQFNDFLVALAVKELLVGAGLRATKSPTNCGTKKHDHDRKQKQNIAGTVHEVAKWNPVGEKGQSRLLAHRTVVRF
jgi:hypothetical protein